MSQQRERGTHGEHDAYVEVLPSGMCRAQLLDLPGCFAIGLDVWVAVSHLERSIPAYYDWLRSHDEYTPIVSGPFRVQLMETQEVAGPLPYQADAFFGPDNDPVSNEDLDWLLALLEWALDDLLQLGERISPDQRDLPTRAGPPPNRLLHQAATAQAGYLVILNAQPDPYAEITLPDAPPLEQLREVKEVSLRRLRNVPENDRGRIVEVLGMRWSLRKILRCGILSARMYAEPLAAVAQ
ncbi:MAG TPA: hypothetical protein VFW76_10775 [Ktedonobacterales bacterium]|nr:hypothetical protein [Ktedonobacterales bacterium]